MTLTSTCVCWRGSVLTAVVVAGCVRVFPRACKPMTHTCPASRQTVNLVVPSWILMQTRPVMCALGGGAEGLGVGLAASQVAHHVHAHPVDSMQTAMFGPTPTHQDSTFAPAIQHVSDPPRCGLPPALCGTAIRGA